MAHSHRAGRHQKGAFSNRTNSTRSPMLRARFLALKIQSPTQELGEQRRWPANVSKRGIYDLRHAAPRVKNSERGLPVSATYALRRSGWRVAELGESHEWLPAGHIGIAPRGCADTRQLSHRDRPNSAADQGAAAGSNALSLPGPLHAWANDCRAVSRPTSSDRGHDGRR